ncbi:hypothetical protein BGO17_01570 [Candidatus Saccharibacteria bacterium 49-20]|nr:MAG: hypothetical protein BGO17_01570 [Candidatus Saccharibacteria bacterium 49-20]
MEATKQVDLITLADAVRRDLRSLLSAWCKAHPNRLVMVVPIGDIPTLAPATQEQALRALTQLDGYVGAPLNQEESKTPIPYKYELHPSISGVVEVLLVTDRLEAEPIPTLVEELTLQVKAQGSALDVDDTFVFRPPNSILSYVEKLPDEVRVKFRPNLNEALANADFTPAAYEPTYALTIRRTG